MKGFGIIEPMEKVGWMEKEKPKADYFGAVLEPVAIAPCSSDVHTAFEAGKKPYYYDRILGHEAIGRIVEIGDGVKEYKVGDVVLVSALTPNWLSLDVQDGMYQHSDRLFGGMLLSITLDGAMAEYFYVPFADQNLARIPDSLSTESALMCTDMVATGFTAVDNAKIEVGDKVCVIGIGPVGLMAVKGSVLRGAAEIYAVGSRPNCVALAKDFGATEIINYKEGAIDEQVLELTKNRGVDKVIIAGGGSGSITSAYSMVRPGGAISSIDLIFDPTIKVDPLAWGAGCANKSFVGGILKGGNRYLTRLMNMVAAGRFDPAGLITHKFQGFEKIEEGYELMRQKPADLIKPMITI